MLYYFLHLAICKIKSRTDKIKSNYKLTKISERKSSILTAFISAAIMRDDTFVVNR